MHGGDQADALVAPVWREVRVALEDKLRSYTLAQFAAKSLEEMYYI